MTVAERSAEVDRRNINRRAGRSVTDDGPAGREVAVELPEMCARRLAVACAELVLPWSFLVPDNAKYAPAYRGGRPVLILSAAYRAGKKKAEDELRDQMTNGAYPVHPLQGRLMLVARMFEPNRSSRRDIANYAKMVHDALTGIVYEDDSQLDRVTWIRAGVDIDRPRLELTITVLPTVPTHSPEK